MLRNDGNCLDCDYGDTVDRIQFVTEPFAGWYVTPMLDFNSEGLSHRTKADTLGEPVDLTTVRRRAQPGAGHRAARHRAAAEGQAGQQPGRPQLRPVLHLPHAAVRDPDGDGRPVRTDANPSSPHHRHRAGFVPRGGTLYIPDLWLQATRRSSSASRSSSPRSWARIATGRAAHGQRPHHTSRCASRSSAAWLQGEFQLSSRQAAPGLRAGLRLR